jgi:hypothetical protein
MSTRQVFVSMPFSSAGVRERAPPEIRRDLNAIQL